MKIKFDIKYRDKIEAGKYKVVTYNGTPVRIERWDLKGNYPILVILSTEKSDFEGEETWFEDRPFVYATDGHCPDKIPSDKYYQLYIETGDKLTESERMLYNKINDHVYNRESVNEDEVHEWMKENFLPQLIKDCETNGDYFIADGIKYLNIKNYSDGL